MLFNKNGRERTFSEIPIVLKDHMLIPEINKLIDYPERAKRQIEITVRDWDYKDANVSKILNEVFFESI